MSLDEAFNWAIKMHPDELQGLTNGAVNPIGDLKTGAWQAFSKPLEKTIKKTYEVKKNTPSILRLNGSLISPLFIFPDEEKIYLEKLNKKKITF